MFDSISREFLGKYGRMLLDFVLSNGLVICSIVVIYGAFLIYAQRNMENIGKKAKTMEIDDVLCNSDPVAALAAKEHDFWEALRKASRFPFISLPTSFLLYPVNQTNINKLLIHMLSPKHKKLFSK